MLVVTGKPTPEDKNCRRRIVGGAWWSDCGVTRITLNLTKFGMRVIGCGSFITSPKGLATVGVDRCRRPADREPGVYPASDHDGSAGPRGFHGEHDGHTTIREVHVDRVFSDHCDAGRQCGGANQTATYTARSPGPASSPAYSPGNLNAAGRRGSGGDRRVGNYAASAAVMFGGVSRNANGQVNVLADQSNCQPLQ